MTDTLRGSFAVVTGASRGIGYETALGLAARGARVLLAGRDPTRLEAARAAVAERGRAADAPEPMVQQADLATAAGVATLVQALVRLDAPIDVLVNNAGAIFPERTLTEDGVERTFALNHVAPFRLTLGVYPLLRRAPAARVITVSSDAHRAVPPPYEDWQSARRYTPMLAYARSKLANILFTTELARRLQGTSVTANAFHPGLVRTDFPTGTRGLLRLLFALSTPFMRPPERGADTAVYLATSPEVVGGSGLYFVDRRPRNPSAAARDPALAASLWRASEALTGMTL